MADLDKLRKEYEDADARARKLSGEYQEKVDKQVTAKWQDLKDRYRDRINEANEQAQLAQRDYMDAQALEALKARPDAEKVLADLDKDIGRETEGSKRLRQLYQESTTE